MFRKQISSVTVPTELFQVEPLQDYLCALALHSGVPADKMLPLKVLVEEVFTHIVEKCFQGRDDAFVTIGAELTKGSFILTFSFRGLPFAYNLDSSETEQDEISLTLIRSLSSTYRMKEDGKRGQSIEISLALASDVISDTSASFGSDASDGSGSDASDGTGSDASANPAAGTASVNEKQSPGPVDEVTELRQVRSEEMEKMVQCLYKVFGYTYSAESIYYPDLLRERLAGGLYKGFVAVNGRGDIVAHSALLKSSADASICECGQAFVSPDYEHRGLFRRLKKMLIEEADKIGLRGVFSSAVTGHPYTQMANLSLGCIETGLELSYIPHNLKSVIHREGEEQRQAVMSYFIPTSHQRKMTVYVPARHEAIITSTYSHLNLERDILVGEELPFVEESSEIEEIAKPDWNQLYIIVHKPGEDLGLRVRRILRRAMAYGTAVAYCSLKLTDPLTPHIVSVLEEEGFVYSGTMPYEEDDCDVVKLQFLADTNLNPDYIIAHSDWGKELKNYVMTGLKNVE